MKPSVLVRTVAVGVVFAATLLSGCSLLESKKPREQLYALRPAESAAPAATAARPEIGAGAIRLQVQRPSAQPGLESPRITLLHADGRLDYFANGRWPGALPQVFGGMLGDTLRASGDYADVQDDRSGFSGDYVLATSIRHFEAQYAATGPDADGVPVAYVVVECTLASRDRRIVDTFRAESRVPAAGNRLGQIVAALERAAQEAAGNIRTRVTQELNQANVTPLPRP